MEKQGTCIVIQPTCPLPFAKVGLALHVPDFSIMPNPPAREIYRPSFILFLKIARVDLLEVGRKGSVHPSPVWSQSFSWLLYISPTLQDLEVWMYTLTALLTGQEIRTYLHDKEGYMRTNTSQSV